MAELPPGEYVRIGGEIDRVRVSLRITGEDLDPDEITALLGVEPTTAHRKGDGFGGGRGVRRAGHWSLSIGDSPEWELADAIAELLDRVPTDPHLWATLSDRYGLDLFCGLFLDERNRGTILPAGLLQRITERRLALSLDIYCDSLSET